MLEPAQLKLMQRPVDCPVPYRRMPGKEKGQKPWGRIGGVISIFCGYQRILA